MGESMQTIENGNVVTRARAPAGDQSVDLREVLRALRAMRDGDFESEYSQQGDGTVPIELARLAGARHSYVECGHSDMPLADRVIAGTIDLLKTGATQRFAAAPPSVTGREPIEA